MNKKKKIILFDIDYTIFDTDIFKKSLLVDYVLYEEVHEILLKLSKIASLGIFSEGDIVFQRKKLHETKIEKYFLEEHMHLVAHKNEVIEKILNKYENEGEIFLIDDKLTILFQAFKYHPEIYTVWVKRGIYATNQKPIPGYKPFLEVENLREIIPFIQNI